jgi:hypothetical protein
MGVIERKYCSGLYTPIPGTFDQAERQMVTRIYPGILAGAPVVPGSSVNKQDMPHHRSWVGGGYTAARRGRSR